MLAFLDESEFFRAFRANPSNEQIIAFLGSDYETFKQMASVYDFSEADWAILEGGLTSGRFMLRAPTQSRPDVRDFEEWIERWTGIEFDYSNFAQLPYYHKAEAKAAMEMSEQFEEGHEIFC